MFPAIHSLQEISIRGHGLEGIISTKKKGFATSIAEQKQEQSKAYRRKSLRRTLREVEKVAA